MNENGQDIEREVRRQAQERARRQGGPSTAALEAILRAEIIPLTEKGASVRSIVAAHADAIAALTGVRAISKQRALVKGAMGPSRLFVGSWGGFGDAAERGLAQSVAEAQEEYAAETARRLSVAADGGLSKSRGSEAHLRNIIVRDAATSGSAQHRLEQANAALADNGFPGISARTLRRILY